MTHPDTRDRRGRVSTPRRRARMRWYSMVARCTNPNHKDYRWYGARGITVCPEWMESFDAYYAYVGDAPAPGLTLDRIDNDGNYEPGNVRWATKLEQTRNRRQATHCSKGHEYTPENTYVYAKRGERHCRTCKRDGRLLEVAA